ncbi:MAG: cellulase family glycosylhydrolase [Chloroflexi bacterium]|nr:cellulase family glycosylhydrolase [Chloroflexota bacterium]
MTGTIARSLAAASLIVCLCSLLAACAAETPVNVAPEVELEAIATQPSELPALGALPAVNGNPLPTLDASLPTATADDRSFGSIIEPGYTQPPTSTPRPTERPTATAVVLPSTRPASAYTTPAQADRTRLNRAEMGIQVHYNLDTHAWSRTLHQIAALRVDWIKLQASWKWLQPNRPGEFEQNFRLFQLYVQEADKRGFKVLLSIAKAPDWARNYDRNEDGPPDDFNELHWFIFKLIEKLGPYIDAIEIWNEPNLRREWTGGFPLSGVSYMELFRVGYKAVREFSPNTTVITAGLAPTGNHSGVSVDDRAFLRQMYQAGLAEFPDVKIGIHPYSWGNPPDFICCNNVAGQGWDDRPQFFFLQTIRDYSSIIAAHGHQTRMWVTEFGWATWEHFPTAAPEVWMAYNSALDQRDYTLRAFQIGQSRADIGLMILWNLNFAHELSINQRSELASYSILYPSLDGSSQQRERPLYSALAARA